MKNSIYSCLLILLLLSGAVAAESSPNRETLTLSDMESVTNFFRAYDLDKNKLTDLRSDSSQSSLRNKIITHYEALTNQVSLERQFVVATCMVVEQRNLGAACVIAEAYASQNPTNDAAWALVGAASLSVKNIPRALEAYGKALDMGRTNVVAILCGVALHSDLNIVKKNIPLLLGIIRNQSSERTLKQDALAVAVAYALRIEDEHVFLMAVEGLDMSLLRDKRELLDELNEACHFFASQKAEEFCTRIKKAFKTTATKN